MKIKNYNILWIFGGFFIAFSVGSCKGETGVYVWDADVQEDIQADADVEIIQDVPHDVPDEDIPQLPVCGNGRLEDGEVCDDGNTRSGDGCNASCTRADGVDFVAADRTVRDQETPVLAGFAGDNADFVLLYGDFSGADGGGSGIRMARFAADGRKLDEITANNVVGGGNQHTPAAAVSGGHLLVVWVNEKAGATFEAGVRGRLFDAAGQELLAEFQVDTSFGAPDLHASAAGSDDGHFLVVWTDTSGEGGADLKGRLFDAAGSPVVNGITGDSGEFVLPVPTAGLQVRARASALPGGRFLVVYEDASGVFDAFSAGISAAVLNPDGTLETSAGLNSLKAGNQASPDAIVMENRIAACWVDDSHAFDVWEWGVHCRVFDTALNPMGDDFLANETTVTSQLQPRLCPLSMPGGFLVVWEDWSSLDGFGAGVRGRRFDASGAPAGGEFSIPSTTMGHQTRPVCLKRGEFFWFAWEDTSHESVDTDGTAIRMRILPEANLVGP